MVIRVGTEKDASAFVELFNNTYDKKINNDYYYWRYDQVPNAWMLAYDEDELVGCYGTQHYKTTDGYSDLLIDLIVRPDHRGKGLANKIKEEMWKLVPYRHAISNDLGIKIYPPENRLAILPVYSRRTELGPEVMEPVSYFGEWSDEMFNEFQRLNFDRFMMVRDAEYLNQRYMDHPLNKYFFYKCDTGFIVLKMFVNPVNNKATGDIVDLVWLDYPSLEFMLKFAFKFFYLRGVNEVNMFEDWSFRHVLEKMGFEKSGRYHNFASNHHRNRGDWYLTMGDAEVY